MKIKDLPILGFFIPFLFSSFSYGSYDIPAEAATLEVGGGVSGSMLEISPGIYNRYDWYKINLTSDGTLKMISQTDGVLDIQLYFYYKVDNMQENNPSGSYIGGGGNITSDTIIAKLRPGTYYLQVIGRNNTGSYSVNTSFTIANLLNDEENNDTPFVAKNLNINSSTTGHLGYYSYEEGLDVYDWYKVVIPGNGKYTIISETSDGDLDLQLYIYRHVNVMSEVNPSGDYIGGGGDVHTDTVIDFLSAQTIYIQVIRRIGTGSYTLKSSFTPATLEDDGDSNEIPATSKNLIINSSLTGNLGYYSSKKGIDIYDWYRIVTPSDGKLTIFSETSDENFDIQTYIYRYVNDTLVSNPSGNYVGGGGTIKKDTVFTITDNRILYLQVIRRSGVGSYNLISNFHPAELQNDLEDNDIPINAVNITSDTLLTGHLGYFKNDLSVDSYDWYKITTTSPRQISFISQSIDGDLDLQMYLYSSVNDMNSNNTSGVYIGGGGTNDWDSVSMEAQVGTYYLQIIRRSGTGSYYLWYNVDVKTGKNFTTCSEVKTKQEFQIVTDSKNYLQVKYFRLMPGSLNISIYDLKGLLIARREQKLKEKVDGRVELFLRNIASGQYVLKIQNNNIIEKKVIRISY